MKSRIFVVQTRSGIKFSVEAANQDEAELRASAPDIGIYLAQLMQQAVNDVTAVTPLRGPMHLAPGPVFEDSIFQSISQRRGYLK